MAALVEYVGGHRQGLPVRTVLVLLRPGADSRALTGLYRKQFAGEAPYLEFRYRVVRVWQVPVAALLASGLGLLPLAPLAAVEEAQLPGIIGQMQERLNQEKPPQAEVLWTTYILMGLRYSEAFAAQLLQGVRAMEESVTYQAIINKGIAKGRAEGALEELRKTLLRQGPKRFRQPPDAATVAALDAITDLDRLERLSERLLEVNSWEELLAMP